MSGWDFNAYLTRLRQIESGGRDNAVSPTGAKGPFQFTSGTWARYGHGSPFDLQAATAATAALTQDNANVLQRALGRAPAPGELYLAHQQGAGGAAKLLANPNARAGDLVGDRAVALNGGDPNMPAGAFAQKWISKFPGDAPAGGFGVGGVVANGAAAGLGAPSAPAPAAPAVAAALLPPDPFARAASALKSADPGFQLMGRRKQAVNTAPSQPNLILGGG